MSDPSGLLERQATSPEVERAAEEGGGIEPLGLLTTTPVFKTGCPPLSGALCELPTNRTPLTGFGDQSDPRSLLMCRGPTGNRTPISALPARRLPFGRSARGPGRNRTGCLPIANGALSQVSYRPKSRPCASLFRLPGFGSARRAVLRRRRAQVDRVGVEPTSRCLQSIAALPRAALVLSYLEVSVSAALECGFRLRGWNRTSVGPAPRAGGRPIPHAQKIG